MTKVKVSKEVAEVLDMIKKLSKDNLNESFQRLGGCLYNQNVVVNSEVYNALRSHKEEWELFNALQFGYEVEQTPEENLLDYYMKAVKFHYSDAVSKGQREGILAGIKTTLDLLEIKIDGINQ